MRLISPENIDSMRWFNGLRMSFANFYIPALLKEEDWKNIALYLRGVKDFKGYVPSPYGFKSWRDWARIFYSNNAGG